MQIKTISLGHIAANCYLVSSDNAAIVIDPGLKNEAVADFLKENSDKQRLILLTHSHFDHIGGAEYLRDETDTKIAISEIEASWLSDGDKNLSNRFRAHIAPFSADILLKDRQNFSVGDLNITVMNTPGHTAGSVCYLINDVLFSGDTLFYMTFGRTDFYSGDSKTLRRSLDYILNNLPEEMKVYPGHEMPTTIGYEKLYNPYKLML